MLSSFPLRQLQEWSQYLELHLPYFKRFDVSYGKSGIALFYLYKYKLLQETADLIAFHQLTADAIDQMTTMASKDQYFIQLTELAFFLRLYQEEITIEHDITALLEQIDDMLVKAAMMQIQQQQLDGFSGAGFQVYYLLHTRGQHPLLNTFIEQVATQVQQSGSYAISLQPGQKAQPGIIHGISFLLLILSGCLQKNILPEICQDLLKGISNYLLSHRQEETVYHTYFPHTFGHPSFSRLNICYGDAGILTALLKSAQVTGDQSLMEFVERGIAFSAGRRSADQNGIDNNGILYGYSGISLWLQRLQQQGIGINAGDMLWWQQQQENGIAGLNISSLGIPASQLKPLSFAEGATGAFVAMMSRHLQDNRFCSLLYLP
ncbi:lanthionine synthetase-like protein [Chitinophaga dinghuensis]|uniref:Lanthionine synthetase-like protein n=1 Tax=Chitinophaga dinghuensis TaxID=1539050 RepID=A0A327VMH0_9BACT|nr:lanthionine synthetase LanC family protein [Chitinophaga dinghuensis]RAJ74061.1 lanthionine synthetase-like protein [Chitinophaga dinghuensis]